MITEFLRHVLFRVLKVFAQIFLNFDFVSAIKKMPLSLFDLMNFFCPPVIRINPINKRNILFYTFDGQKKKIRIHL